MAAALPKNMTGILCAISGFSLYAVSDACMKYTGQYHTPTEVGFWTQAFGLVILIGTAVFGKMSLKTRFPKLQAIRSLALAVTYFSVIFAFQHLALADAYTIFFCSPFIVAVLSVLILGEKIGLHRILCVCCGFIGVLIVLRPGLVPLNIGALAVLIGATTFGISNVLSRKIGEGEPLLAFSFYPTLFICLLFGAYSLFLPWNQPNSGNMTILAVSGMMESIGALFVARAFILTHAVTIMKFNYFNLIWAVVLGYLIFGDVMDGWTVLGATIIIGSGLYLAHREYKDKDKGRA